MRSILNFNSDWRFSKTAVNVPDTLPDDWEKVNLPHTWNASDGQDGGNDYYRGRCLYVKAFGKAELPEADRYYIEFRGANSSAEIFINGKSICTHDGGYSTFRADLTDFLEEDNIIAAAVDNSPNDTVYPQMADFTFYGGLYRDVNLICVSEAHFDLLYNGAPGISVTPTVTDNDAQADIEVYLKNVNDSHEIDYIIEDRDGNTVAEESTRGTEVSLEIKNVHLWKGRKDPYLYTVKAILKENGKPVDNISARFGCRTFRIDPERGFILNGEEYPLRGVSRHQDRWGIGNALLPEHHKEDMDIICEVGANTIRLAHYQHDQYFYDLCDERGMVVWAEIPYISRHMPAGRENTISQMKELISQNYNHPSIVVWGLSNEITITGSDPDLIENHKLLNDMVHKMDKTRLTTMACLSSCKTDDPYTKISDVLSYNHYFGWYGGETDMNGPWFDKFHRKYPDRAIGCSEYGCEALNWHTSDPKQGDYTEEYQAYYHEELIKQFFTRRYLWATHVWNMFDFGADARSEGGENGQNHKGLVTFDRKYKKDAFYAYKAWLSDEKFVHLCGKRYVDRAEDVTKVTVYSNMDEVELFANGESVGKKKASDHFFRFEVPNKGTTVLKAVAGDLSDEGTINKVEKMNEAYILRESGAVLNWFDVDAPEGYFSLNDKVSDIMKTVKGKLFMAKTAKNILGKMKKDKKEEKDGASRSIKIGPEMMQMLGGFTLLRLSNMAGMMNVKITKEELLDMNRSLNKIKKPKNK